MRQNPVDPSRLVELEALGPDQRLDASIVQDQTAGPGIGSKQYGRTAGLPRRVVAPGPSTASTSGEVTSTSSV